jgi:hypothetical protein
MYEITCDGCGAVSEPSHTRWLEGWQSTKWKDGVERTHDFCPKCIETIRKMLLFASKDGIKLNSLWLGRTIIKLEGIQPHERE